MGCPQEKNGTDYFVQIQGKENARGGAIACPMLHSVPSPEGKTDRMLRLVSRLHQMVSIPHHD